MRATLTAISAVALLAAAAGPAAARPADMPLRQGLAPLHRAVVVPSRGVQHRYGGDATAVPAPAQTAPVPTVHVTTADNGVNWADVGIGGGLAAALLLGAAGVSAARRHPTTTAR